MEVVRQVQVHCSERGQLLEAIRVRYSDTMEKLMAGRADDLAAMQQAGEEKQKDDEERIGRMHKHAFLFARAAHGAKVETMEGNLTEEQKQRRNLEMQMRLDAEQLNAKLRMTNEQLAEAKRKLAELEARANKPSSANSVYESFISLSAAEQLSVEPRILLSEGAPAILPPAVQELVDKAAALTKA